MYKNNKTEKAILTARQLEVLELISHGKLNKQIADIIGISLNSLENHTAALFQRLNVHCRAHAVRKGFELGLLQVCSETATVVASWPSSLPARSGAVLEPPPRSIAPAWPVS